MNKNEWLAEKCGFYKQGCCWHDPSQYPADLPDFEHSIDALVKWVLPKFPGAFDIKISLLAYQGDAYAVTIHGEYAHSAKSFDLNKACFDACCMSLGWKEPGEEQEPLHDDSIMAHILAGELPILGFDSSRINEEVTLHGEARITVKPSNYTGELM